MGELLALLTALLYSAAVILYKRAVGVISPFGLNLFKNTVALICLGVTAILARQTDVGSIKTEHMLLIVASGVLGIGVSDTLFLMTLKRLGASRTAVVDCLYSPSVILFSFLTVGETLEPVAILGGALIIGSVLLSAQRGFGVPISRRDFWVGCGLGALAMATVAYAIVMLKPILNSYPLILMNALRMASGLAMLWVCMPFHPERKRVYAELRPNETWPWMLGGAFLGSYLSIMTWLAGFKYSQAGVVALLNQTSTVMVVVMAAVFLGEPMTRVKVFAVVMAFFGTVVVFY
jgi:drug/metabolite transporter (DMT)-like permease